MCKTRLTRLYGPPVRCLTVPGSAVLSSHQNLKRWQRQHAQFIVSNMVGFELRLCEIVCAKAISATIVSETKC